MSKARAGPISPNDEQRTFFPNITLFIRPLTSNETGFSSNITCLPSIRLYVCFDDRVAKFLVILTTNLMVTGSISDYKVLDYCMYLGIYIYLYMYVYVYPRQALIGLLIFGLGRLV